MAQTQVQVERKTVKRIDESVQEQAHAEHEETLSNARRAVKRARRSTATARQLLAEIDYVLGG